MDISYVQLPDFFEKLLERQYDADTVLRIKRGYISRRLTTFRANTLKVSPEYIAGQLNSAGIEYEIPEWYGSAFILSSEKEADVRALDIYNNGEIYMQSLSSMIPPLIMDIREGECILDMAAAPGSKTTQIAALSGGKAQITACEKNKIRADRLKYNLGKQGALRVTVLNEDARKLDSLFSFDSILLDAPCSGSGTLSLFHKYQKYGGHSGEDGGESASAYIPERSFERTFTKELLERSVKTQEAMLFKALSLLKPGHTMVYSTCSVLEDENELLVSRVLKRAKARLVPIDHAFIKHVPLLPSKLEGTCLICPTERYEGFFAAKIMRI